MRRAKVGDLIRLAHSASTDGIDLMNKTGIITELSRPSPTFPYQVATIAFDNIVCDGIPIRMIEVLNEKKEEAGQ